MTIATRRTFANAKQYAQDRLQDGTGAKSNRQIERVVHRALKRINKARLWNWYLRKLRVTLNPPITMTDLSVAALTNSVQCAGGATAFSTALRQTSLVLSTKTENIRILSVVSSTLALTWPDQPFMGASVGENFSGTGHFIYERIALPRNFRSLYSHPMQSNYLAGLTRISQDDMNVLKRVWDNRESEPIYYCIVQNHMQPDGNQWEFWIWPPPSTLKSVDVIAYFWPEELVDDGDLIDWDPNQDDLLDRAMDVEAAVELENDKKYMRTEASFRRALREAKAAERTDVGGGPAGQQAYKGSKAYRSDHFIDVD
jgi:hypothetical protein